MVDEPANRKVVSRRVTAAGGAGAVRSAKPAKAAKGAAGGVQSARRRAGEHAGSKRYTPPVARKDMPSPTWVPILMFTLLGAGAIVIILNYVGVLGGVSNVKLVVGLALILGGIVTATQYR